MPFTTVEDTYFELLLINTEKRARAGCRNCFRKNKIFLSPVNYPNPSFF